VERRLLCAALLVSAGPLHSVCADTTHAGLTEGFDGLMVRIDTRVQPGAIRLSVAGQLDMTAVSAFDQAVSEAARVRDLVELDLERVDFIDGSGLSTLMDAERRARRARYRLRIVAASRYVRRLIDITNTIDRVSPLLPAAQGPRFDRR
jgi:anti-sigma B factor antagonist